LVCSTEVSALRTSLSATLRNLSKPDEDNAADLGACSPLKVALANFLNLAVNIAAPEETLAMDHLPLSQDSTS
jgi:hypothetical protein